MTSKIQSPSAGPKKINRTPSTRNQAKRGQGVEKGLRGPDGRENQEIQQDSDARGRNNLQGQQPNQERGSGGQNRKG